MRRRDVSTTVLVIVLAAAVVSLRGCDATTAGTSVAGGGSCVTTVAPISSVEPSRGTSRAGLIEARVSKNVDGDTIHVTMPDGADEKVRFIGVNTPESTIRHEPYGKEASAFTKSRLAVGARVWLETDVQLRDTYGRVLAYVWLAPPSGRRAADVRAHMFNAELLLNGYADLMTIPPNVEYVEAFRPMAAEAREAGRGLWGLPAE